MSPPLRSVRRSGGGSPRGRIFPAPAQPPPQHRGAPGTDSGQQQGLGSPHAGETEGEVSPVKPTRRGQHQPSCPGIQLFRTHPAKPLEVQVDGPLADGAAPGQGGLGPAQPRQQRCAEEDGGPHPGGSVPRQGAAHRRAADDYVRPLPPGVTPCSPQQRKAALHVRQGRDTPQPHRPPAEQRRRKERQHAVFRRRHRRRPVQRPPAHHPDPPALLCHIPGPPFSKRYPTVCGGGEICLQFWQKTLPFGELARERLRGQGQHDRAAAQR